jgi:hypothetical protein
MDPQHADLAKTGMAVKKARYFNLCPHRIWAIAGSFPSEKYNLPEYNLPELIPPTEVNWVKGHNEGDDEHNHCTFDFCECSRIDYSSVEQRHECLDKNCKVNGKSMVELPGRFMTISHVWADGTGTGTGTRLAGEVSECLNYFFRQIAEHS